MEKAKIELQKEREFGDIFNAVFGFIGQEFKPLGKAVLIFVLPIIILMSIALVMFQSSYGEMLRNINETKDPTLILQNLGTIIGPLGLYIFIFLLGRTVYAGIVYSYLRLYLTRQGDFKLWDIYEELRKCFFPIIGASILTAIIVSIGLVFCIIPGIYLAISLSMFIPILVIENKGFGDAFSRSFKIVGKKWWWTFLILLVAGIMVAIISGILSIPAMIMGISNVFLSIKSGNPADMYIPGYIIYSSITSAISQLFYIIPYLAIAFQYFSIVEMEERPSLDQKIDQLGENV
jgi:hypothetical protein